jgi:hypothetical protein
MANQELSLTDKILSFLGMSADFVKINDLLKMELKQTVGMQHVNKQLRGQLQKLVDDGKIVVKDDKHKVLGACFYISNDPHTQFRSALNVQIEAKLA